jgi:4-hydroxy-tetrahydrodipicolinate synthase
VTASALTGLWPPVSTPFASDGSVASDKLVKHSRTLLEEGATGLAILGTTSEANSLTVDERRRVIDAHVEGGIDAGRLLPGTGACAIDDVVTLSRHVGKIGAAGVLLLPPFYYKGVSDDGLFDFVARVIERCGGLVPRIMLYHIPPMAVLGWSHGLIARLIEAFPDVVVGIKDSSGDVDHTLSLIDTFPGFAVFPGAEVYLLRAMRRGASGCISATANVNAKGIVKLLEAEDTPEADALQKQLNAVRTAVQSRGLIQGNKAVLAARYKDDSWINVRPPLLPLGDAARAELVSEPAIAQLLA